MGSLNPLGSPGPVIPGRMRLADYAISPWLHLRLDGYTVVAALQDRLQEVNQPEGRWSGLAAYALLWLLVIEFSVCGPGLIRFLNRGVAR